MKLFAPQNPKKSPQNPLHILHTFKLLLHMQVAEKKYTLHFVAVFSAVARNFKAKFYRHI